MSAKKAHDAARAKAAKEKKILLVLAPVFLVAIFFAYHTLTKLHGSGGSTPPPAPVSTVSTGTPVSQTTPVVATPIATPPADSGKLSVLPGFAPKDPFHDAGPHATVAKSGGTSKQAAAKQTAQKKAPVPPPTSAVIAVNGRLSSVAVGTIFPLTKDPATTGVFKLVSLTAKTAKVAVTGGSYSSGAHTLTLTVNSVVTLENTADGKRYTLILYPPGTLLPGSVAAPAAPVTTTTTPTTTSGP